MTTEPYARVPESVLESCTGEAVRLYAFIDRYANDQGEAWPSRTTLAARMGCSRSKVDRLLRELVQTGSLAMERRRDPAGDPTSNLYRVAPRMRLGSRTRAATPSHPRGHGGRTDAATGSPTDDAQNQSQSEREPTNESSSVSTTDPTRATITSDDDTELVTAAFRALAERHLQRRNDEARGRHQPITEPQRRAAWIARDVDHSLEQLGVLARGYAAVDPTLTPDALADLLDDWAPQP